MNAKILSHPSARFAGKLLVAVLLISYLGRNLDWATVGRQVARAELAPLLLATFILIARHVLGAYRWRVLLRTKGHEPPLQALYQYYLIGAFFNFFLPTAVGGDVARGYYLHRWGVDKKEAAGSIVLERILGVTVLVLLSGASLCLASSLALDARVVGFVIAMCLCWLIVLALLFGGRGALLERTWPSSLNRILAPVCSVLRDMRSYKASLPALAIGLLATIAFQSAGIFATYLLGVAIGCPVSLGYYFVLLPIVWLVAMIPISINGLGLREGAFVVLFVSIGMSKEAAIAISVLFLAQAMLQGLIGGVLFLVHRKEGKTVSALAAS